MRSGTGTQSIEVRNTRIQSAETGVSITHNFGNAVITESSIQAIATGVFVDANAGTTTRIRNTYIDSTDNLNFISGFAACSFISQADGSTFAESCE